jgi:hypothetical protein
MVKGPVSSINKTDCHDIAEILLKVVLNTINHTINIEKCVIGYLFIFVSFHQGIFSVSMDCVKDTRRIIAVF